MIVIQSHTTKEGIVRDYIKKFSIGTFIETGTYEGIMVNAIYPHVKTVCSIELDEKLHVFARNHFKDNPNVHIFCGDSGELLPGILAPIKEPCLFWLDAHYSEGITARGDVETPILKELEAILNSPHEHIVLIDDARLYTGEGDWPTIDKLKAIILKAHPDWVFEVKDDIIRTHHKRDFISMTTLGSFGQFGNQLFQYAALKRYAKENDLKTEIPETWPGRKVFADCNDPPITETPREQKIIENRTPIWLNGELRNCDIKGYLQYHTKYYDRDYFRSLFRFKPELEDAMSTLHKEIKGKASTLVAIHIRRGDYDIPTRRHCIAPNEWYLDWLRKNWDKLDNPVLFIASDEIDKVREDFKGYNPTSFKDDNFLCDYYILQNSDILLISNSTFSFTAAMLNERADKFFRPDFEKGEMASFDPWNSEPVLKVDIKLHLGCGGQRHEGYINIDCKKTPATDLICDIRKLPYPDNAVDVIESYHVFEHIPVCLHANVSSEYGEKYVSLITVLKEWRRVLKKDGLLVIEVPDLDGIVKEYLAADEKGREKLLIGIYGSYRDNDNVDIHRWGANKARLMYMLKKAGFRDIRFCEAQDYHIKDCPCLRMEAVK